MEYFVYIGTLIAIYATLTISLNLLVGYTGLISIAQAGDLRRRRLHDRVAGAAFHTRPADLVRCLPRSPACWCRSIVALPSLRLKNEYFLIATMGFQAIIYSLFMNLEITGGASGLYGIPHPTLFGYTIRTSFEKFLLAVALAVVCYLLALRITRAPFGRLLRAVREDQTAVASLGKSVFAHQVLDLHLLGGLRRGGGHALCLLADRDRSGRVRTRRVGLHHHAGDRRRHRQPQRLGAGGGAC